jgi:hypothetical protein
MQNRPWDRQSRIKEIREKIWSYMSPSSVREGPGLVVAAALLGWPEDDITTLAQLHFLLSPEVHEFIARLPELSRRLATTSSNGREVSNERIRGAVNWGQTMTTRSATGDSQIHVTNPVERAHQTAENELLVHVLDTIVRLAHASGWDRPNMKSEPAAAIRNHLVEGKKWQNNRMLSEIKRASPRPQTLTRIASSRTAARYGHVVAAYEKLEALVERLDRTAIRSAIEEVGLVTAQEHVLFELLTLFQSMAALEAHGWKLQPLRLFHGAVHTHGFRGDGRRIDVWYQPAPSPLGMSRYAGVLTHHGFPQVRELRPDLVVRWQSSSTVHRTLLIECKFSEHGVAGAARSALLDLLAYRHAFATALADSEPPYGLGVAWGADLAPRLDSEVMLCTPDQLEVALSTTAEHR